MHQLANFLGNEEVIECSKSRDILTRKLSNFEVNADDLNGKDCLVIDDICDGGRTFIGLAKALKNKNAGKLFLAVSHGIFSNGISELSKYYKKIYTTDAFKSNDKGIVEIKFKEMKLEKTNKITYLIGDATQPIGNGNKLIVHICNDIGGWGRGFVLAISKDGSNLKMNIETGTKTN